MTQEFENICNNESKEIKAIINAIHTLPNGVERDDVYPFLSFVNSLIDFYLEKPLEEHVRYPIIYIPASEDWAKEVCIKFLILKMSLIYDKNTL